MFYFLLIIVNNFYVCFLKMMNKILRVKVTVIISVLNSIKMNIDRNCRNDFFCFLEKTTMLMIVFLFFLYSFFTINMYVIQVKENMNNTLNDLKSKDTFFC